MLWSAGGGWLERGSQFRDQRYQLSGDLLAGGIHVLRLGAIANQLLQRAGSGLHVRGAEVAGHTLERVRKPLGRVGCPSWPRRR